MATQLATNRTKAENPTSDNILSPGTIGGRVRTMTDDFTFAGEGAGEIIEIFRDLRAGAIVLGIRLKNAALAGSVTVRIGDSNDDDRYMTDIAVSSAADTNDINIAGLHYKIGTNSGDETIQILTAASAATGEIKVTLFYTED